MLENRRRMLFSWVAALSIAAAACDSPTFAPRSADPAGPTRLVATTTAVAAREDLFPNCTLTSSQCEGTGSISITEPDGDKIPVRTSDNTTKRTLVVGQDTFVFQVGIHDVDNETGGNFLFIIWKNGQFVGYFGQCLWEDGDNKAYMVTENGKTYIHYENTHQPPSTSTEMWHYIYDPQTNTLKIFYRPNGGTAVEVYRGPPIKNQENLRPPLPQNGAGPWTSENQFDPNSGTGTTGTGTGTGTTGGTGTGSTGTSTGTGTTSPTPTTSPTTTSPTSGTTTSPTSGTSYNTGAMAA